MSPQTTVSEDSSGYPRLEDQIGWYDRSSIKAQRSYRTVKILQIVVAAAIPVASLLNPNDAVVPGALGALILIMEGVQELGMYRQNWQKYRSNCEALRHEKYLYMAMAGPFEGLSPEDARRMLAQRVEKLISQEHSNWVSQFQDTNAGTKPA